MKNAKYELQHLMEDLRPQWIVAARFYFGVDDPSYRSVGEPIEGDEAFFGLDGTAVVLDDLWSFLDREYHAGYGTQNLFGTVWLSDGSWLVRREYDGSEWWEHINPPPLPTTERPWGGEGR